MAGQSAREAGKRLVDVVVAVIVLLLVLPVLFGTALAIRMRLGSPVLFRQERPGKDNTVFWIYKFRTMSDGRDESGQLQPDEMRLGTLGKLLRATSVDELPELVNVIRGEMSLVGPRPLLPQYLPLYNAHQIRRHEMRPGLTGWAQINGRNLVSWSDRFDMDVWYVDNWNLMLDLRIILRTVVQVVRPTGITEPGRATMGHFVGTAPSPDRAGQQAGVVADAGDPARAIVADSPTLPLHVLVPSQTTASPPSNGGRRLINAVSWDRWMR